MLQNSQPPISYTALIRKSPSHHKEDSIMKAIYNLREVKHILFIFNIRLVDFLQFLVQLDLKFLGDWV